jgi:hypothetical protein
MGERFTFGRTKMNPLLAAKCLTKSGFPQKLKSPPRFASTDVLLRE